LLAKGGQVSFIEIKAEGDVIRRNPLTRLRQLGNAGISAEIGRWLPLRSRAGLRRRRRRDYRGLASSDRITEIGAVKIRNHQVVGEWHSLLNPQRSIPGRIVQLTGITNDMVRGAPLFAEMADSFMQFMDDGIIVAHNVNFDFGFHLPWIPAPGASIPLSQALHLCGNAATLSGS
jgi:DNA polymerase III subunit epsilon